MRVRHPWAEAPYELGPDMADLVFSLTHYDLDNGYTVSVLHAPSGLWEAWAWPTGSGHREALTAAPLVFDTEAEALAYRDELRGRPTNDEGETT